MFEKLISFFKKSGIKKNNSLAQLTPDEKCELKKLQSVPNLKEYGKKHCNFYTFVPISCTGTSDGYDEAISDEENVVGNRLRQKIITDGLCKICLESLQMRRIFSCITCNKIVCADCFSKLRHCPYCRNPTISKRERNLEQFVNSLALPCKNFSNGCNKLIKSNNRRNHESACRYNDLECPIGHKSCKWNGIATELLSHLKEQHLIAPTNGYGLTIVINDFWKKMSFKSDIEHKFLECYHQLFYLRVTYQGGVLSTSLKKLIFLTDVSDSVKETLKQFNVHVTIRTDNTKKYEQVYLIKDKRSSKFFIDCGRLLADDIFDFIKVEFKILLTD
ncbi:GSCOCG00013183001-RA-CDS [Cotesia congregata]|uniref:RING-type E3 ubiquitin transferase n=1 Tax=Cotesia congregata TaxID=51543 RepID=A0A8J2MKU8_COTCN|nr:GSCOCG00013183001-RA-CDS [Cotesia congregata]CAG5092964.1 Similar to siah-1: E3 ubiquitin-protein ligase siah-1 (Caenorhabditis briggsae) [Cotesia congregata]